MRGGVRVLGGMALATAGLRVGVLGNTLRREGIGGVGSYCIHAHGLEDFKQAILQTIREERIKRWLRRTHASVGETNNNVQCWPA